jgi:hypothetical protein
MSWDLQDRFNFEFFKFVLDLFRLRGGECVRIPRKSPCGEILPLSRTERGIELFSLAV